MAKVRKTVAWTAAAEADLAACVAIEAEQKRPRSASAIVRDAVEAERAKMEKGAGR